MQQAGKQQREEESDLVLGAEGTSLDPKRSTGDTEELDPAAAAVPDAAAAARIDAMGAAAPPSSAVPTAPAPMAVPLQSSDPELQQAFVAQQQRWERSVRPMRADPAARDYALNRYTSSKWRENTKSSVWSAARADLPKSSFACRDRLDLLPHLPPAGGCPKLTVQGMGRLLLPLSPEQAVLLAAACEQAPYGQGTSTVVDTTVRNALQADASAVTVEGEVWEEVLQQMVQGAAKALGVPAQHVEARLYKLLLYEQGGHFKAHQDTEKEDGMFGTLVVQLPCTGGHTGGSLYVWHKGQVLEVDTAKGSDRERGVRWAAFYADCEHELTPITSGRRLCLTFNLLYKGSDAATPHAPDPVSPDLLTAVDKWVAAAKAAAAAVAAGGGGRRELLPLRMAMPLEHKYTQAGLSFEKLKGTDRAFVARLAACPGLDVHLALVALTRITVPGDRYYYGWGNEGEFIDQYESVKWVSPHSTTEVNWGSYKGLEEDYYDGETGGKPIDRRKHGPVNEEYEGYLGNEGPTLSQFYRRALVVVWPKADTSALMAGQLGQSSGLDMAAAQVEEASNSSCSMPDRALALHVALEACQTAIRSMAVPPAAATHLSGSTYWGRMDRMDRYVQRQTSAVRGASGVLRVLVSAAGLIGGDSQRLRDLAVSAVSLLSGQPAAWVDSDAARALGAALRALSYEPLAAAAAALISRCGAERAKAILVLARSLESPPPAGGSLERVEAAALATLLAPAAIASQSQEGLLDTADFILACDRRRATYLAAFASACAERPAAGPLLLQLLQRISAHNAAVDAPMAAARAAIHDALASDRVLSAFTRGADFASLAAAFLPHPELRTERYWGKVVNACLARSEPERGDALRALLATPVVWQNAADQGVQRLAAAREEQLAAMTAPVFSWCMPEANYPDNPEVQEFLGGPEQEFILRGFHGAKGARRVASSLNASSKDVQTSGFTVTTEIGGSYGATFLVVKKTRGWFDQQVERHNLLQNEFSLFQERAMHAAAAPPAGP